MPTKTLYHSELVKMGPVRVTVEDEPSPLYVSLSTGGTAVNYAPENVKCRDFFHGKKGQTFTVIAEGAGHEGTVTYVGESGAALKSPANAPEATQQSSKSPKPAKTAPDTEAPKTAGMRITELRYDRVINTGNYCNEKIGVTLMIEEGTKAADVLAMARKFVDLHQAKEAAHVSGG